VTGVSLLPSKLAGPLVCVPGLPFAVGTIHGDFHAVSSGPRRQLWCSSATPAPILDLASFNFQVPRNAVGGEAHSHADKAQCQSQNGRFLLSYSLLN